MTEARTSPIIKRGGRSQDDVDKFERCAWTAGPGGVPMLDEVANRFVGVRRAWLDPGADHVCLTLSPVRADQDGSATLLRFGDVADIDAGHEAEDRQQPV